MSQLVSYLISLCIVQSVSCVCWSTAVSMVLLWHTCTKPSAPSQVLQLITDCVLLPWPKLVVPATKHSTFGNRAFDLARPPAWNTFLQTSSSLLIFSRSNACWWPVSWSSLSSLINIFHTYFSLHLSDCILSCYLQCWKLDCTSTTASTKLLAIVLRFDCPQYTSIMTLCKLLT